MKIASLQTLVLNSYSTPVSVVGSKRAISLVASEKAIALANYENTMVRSSNFVVDDELLTKSKSAWISMLVPSVIQCVYSDYIPKKYVKVLPFSRQNVYVRDGGCCMYCGKKVSLSGFTFDHVVPRSRGGRTCWENIVVSCIRCNGQKGHKSIGDYKRSLIRQPFAPKLDKAAPAHLVSRIAGEIPHETWVDYIYWNVILDK